MKILLIGILLVCLNTFSGSTFDAITKYLSVNNYQWYHYYSIGGTVAIFFLMIFLNFIGGIKKHIILKQKSYYLLPIFIKVVLITIFKHLIKKSLIPIIKHNDLSKIKIGKKKLFTLIINFILISYLLYILIKTLEV